MKRLYNILTLALLIVSIVFSACKKNKSCEGCRDFNKPPIALAGPDQQITLPTDSILLDGSASRDPDGKISTWLWKKIEGPVSFSVATVANSKTVIKNLIGGVYQFELNVTDDRGTSTKDTVQITVHKSVVNNSPCATFWVGVGNPYDITLNLPVNTARLTASIEATSNQPVQLTISSIEWTKVIGPNNYTIQSPDALATVINNLTDGLYAFQCKITDISGCSRISYGGGVINVTDTSAAGQEVIVYNQPWAAEWYPYVKINLKDHMPLGKSVKKVFVKLDCDANFTQATPSFEFGGTTINLYVYLPFTNSCLTENTKVDVKIIY